jgi:hypothetical protein
MAGIPVDAFGATYNRDVTHRFFRMDTEPRSPDDLNSTLNQCFGKTGDQRDNSQLFHILVVVGAVAAGIAATVTPGQVIAFGQHHQPVLEIIVLAFYQFPDGPDLNFRHLCASSVLATNFKEGVSQLAQ